ncbi:MAG: hypothetical protein OHK93_007101 [Ramalina farinacea]|uniref:Uncharacterized protein n=1 Tax=Ramalina farinacea TaxID=258253 RepID=A0AA43QJU3_9LECA|nr:hypothetical protein [Ramalina farinacea]
MAAAQVLRVPRIDSEGDFVLVNVSSNGSKPLDLKIEATEGESPYITTIKQSRISQFRDSKNSLDDRSWELLLRCIFLYEPIPGHLRSNLEVVAAVTGGKLAIRLRNNIEGIIQNLGEILLKEDQHLELDTIGWASTAILRGNSLASEVQSLQQRYNEQDATIVALHQQLSDLIKAKEDHETALLEKFRELLNEKKLKIRDQQRLLAGAKIDPEHAIKVEAARTAGGKGRKAGDSKVGKRKAAIQESDPEEDAGFGTRPEVKEEESDGGGPSATPEPSSANDDVTEDEDDDNTKEDEPKFARPEKRILGMNDMMNEQGMQLDGPASDLDPPSKQSQDEAGSQDAAGSIRAANHTALDDDETTDDDDDDDEL